MYSKELLKIHQRSKELFSSQMRVLYNYRHSKSKEQRQALKTEYSTLISEEEKLNQKLYVHTIKTP